MKTNKELVSNIVIAMKLCGMKAISEGGLYWALFNQKVDVDAATSAVKYALDNKIIERKGCAFFIKTNGKESSIAERTICNS